MIGFIREPHIEPVSLKVRSRHVGMQQHALAAKACLVQERQRRAKLMLGACASTANAQRI